MQVGDRLGASTAEVHILPCITIYTTLFPLFPSLASSLSVAGNVYSLLRSPLPINAIQQPV